jgi:hypothetical protein
MDGRAEASLVACHGREEVNLFLRLVARRYELPSLIRRIPSSPRRSNDGAPSGFCSALIILTAIPPGPIGSPE